jgi:hypothetical protein
MAATCICPLGLSVRHFLPWSEAAVFFMSHFSSHLDYNWLALWSVEGYSKVRALSASLILWGRRSHFLHPSDPLHTWFLCVPSARHCARLGTGEMSAHCSIWYFEADLTHSSDQ